MSDHEQPPIPAQSPHSATLRHELLTPLSHIIGYSEMLLDEAREGQIEPFVADLQKIRAAGKKLLTLINAFVGEAKLGESVPSHAPDTAGRLSQLRDEESYDKAAVQPAARSGHLLVVDDNEVNRDMLSRRLRQQGYPVSTAEDGRRALEYAKTHRVDLVLLDVMMPVLDGYETLQQLKADQNLRDIPVIMISALDEIQSVARCIEYGAEEYLPKPFNPVLLRARIGACLEKKRLRDQEILYLKDVSRVTAAAASVEGGQFLVDSLADVSQRPDALGQLARVFQRMAQEVAAREQLFKHQIQTLRVEIDETKKSREVAELTETDFFVQLRKKTKALRNESK
jgi:CheY-like chemotaxis protein